MYENVLSQMTPDLWKWLEQDRERTKKRRQMMREFLTELTSKYPTLTVDDGNITRMLQIAKFVEPCKGCLKRVCNRETCKLVTIGEIALYRGELIPRYLGNCRNVNYYVSFGMLANTIVTEGVRPP